MTETAKTKEGSTIASPQSEFQAIKSVWVDGKDKDYVQSISHWRGVGRWNDENWMKIGDSCLRKLDFLLRCQGRTITLEKRNILEWGPGGGANLYGLRSLAENYYGVDISLENLREAERMIKKEGLDIFHPVHLSDNLDVVTAKVTEPIDLFFSTAVFQHFPSKGYGIDVLKTIRKLCRKGANGFIQIRFDNGNEKYKGITDISDYAEKHITANSYGIDEFWSICADTGFKVLSVANLNPTTNYVDFYLEAR